MIMWKNQAEPSGLRLCCKTNQNKHFEIGCSCQTSTLMIECVDLKLGKQIYYQPCTIDYLLNNFKDTNIKEFESLLYAYQHISELNFKLKESRMLNNLRNLR